LPPEPSDDQLSLSGRGQVTWRILQFYTPWNIPGTAEARVVKLYALPCRLCQMLISHGSSSLKRSVARVTWSILEFYAPLNYSGMAEWNLVGRFINHSKSQPVGNKPNRQILCTGLPEKY